MIEQKSHSYKPSILTLTTDPAVREQIHAVVRAQNGRSLVVTNAADFKLAIDRYYPRLFLVDLASENQDTTELIKRSKLLPHTRAMVIVAFGDNEEELASAQQTGADLVLSTADFSSRLAKIVAEQLDPPIRYVEGWDDSLSKDARIGVEEFNRGEYFEQHEFFEAAWMAESRPIRELYQGILQTGVALLQIERNNWTGAVKLFRRGLPKLRPLPPRCQNIDLAAFRAEMEQIHDEISALGPDKLADFDRNRFPKINVGV